MSTAAQVAANIANAKLSTGPASEEGKQRSAQNSLKHGLTAKTVLIPCEDPAEYQEFTTQLLDYWRPHNEGEFYHVEEMIGIQWRLKRCERFEAIILAADAPDFKALNNISLHASRLKRQYSMTFKELNLMQECRYKRGRQNLQQAETIRRADVMAGRETNLKEYGFDFPIDAIDERIRRQDKVESATRAIAKANLLKKTLQMA